ncbi:MAG: hypothetical protein P8M50_04175, partial [Paracoccaceae bacterium]|nr:hypothetical protein [Paracoccaceae bacterium]
MAITFTPIVVNEHDNGAKLGFFENPVNVNAGYAFYHEKPAIFKIVGNELFLEDTWHYDFETQTFYDYTNGLTLAYSNESLTQWAFKDLEDAAQWTYADISIYEDIDELIEVTPVPFSSLETGATIATISTNLPVNEKFNITQNTFVTVDGNNIKLNDNFYYDIESGFFQSGDSIYDPNATSGQIVISSVQVDSQTASETINYRQEFDYSTFLVSIVSQAQQASSSLTFSAVSANEHENGALLGSLQTSGESGGIYSFNSSKPSMLKIVGDQLFLEENYHFDYETSSFYHYTQESNGGTSWSYLGPYSPEELSWRLKYTAPSGAEQFVDVNLSFSDIDEAVTITPVAFNSLEVGTIVATVSHNFLTNSQIELGSNSLLE